MNFEQKCNLKKFNQGSYKEKMQLFTSICGKGDSRKIKLLGFSYYGRK